jgi:hypothetical protein
MYRFKGSLLKLPADEFLLKKILSTGLERQALFCFFLNLQIKHFTKKIRIFAEPRKHAFCRLFKRILTLRRILWCISKHDILTFFLPIPFSN